MKPDETPSAKRQVPSAKATEDKESNSALPTPHSQLRTPKPMLVFWSEEERNAIYWAAQKGAGQSLKRFGEIALAAMLDEARAVVKDAAHKGVAIPARVAKVFDRK